MLCLVVVFCFYLSRITCYASIILLVPLNTWRRFWSAVCCGSHSKKRKKQNSDVNFPYTASLCFAWCRLTQLRVSHTRRCLRTMSRPLAFVYHPPNMSIPSSQSALLFSSFSLVLLSLPRSIPYIVCTLSRPSSHFNTEHFVCMWWELHTPSAPWTAATDRLCSFSPIPWATSCILLLVLLYGSL